MISNSSHGFRPDFHLPKLTNKVNNLSLTTVQRRGGVFPASSNYIKSSIYWVNDNRFKKSDLFYEVEFEGWRDSRGILRYRTRKAWWRGNGIRCLFRGEELTGDDRILALNQLVMRMVRVRGWDDYRNKRVYRYDLAFACAYPYADLYGKELHHCFGTNPWHYAQCYALLEEFNPLDLYSTFDCPGYLVALEPNQHRLIHNLASDRDFHHYKFKEFGEDVVDLELIKHCLDLTNYYLDYCSLFTRF